MGNVFVKDPIPLLSSYYMPSFYRDENIQIWFEEVTETLANYCMKEEMQQLSFSKIKDALLDLPQITN